LVPLFGARQLTSARTRANAQAEFPDNEEVVVQTYLNDPMLIKDRKWDMRTYILITSIHPLRLYMYRDGLVRFATTKYDKDAKDGGKKTAFLTNTSVNKKTGQSVEDLTWPYPQVYEYLKKHDNINPDDLWKRIERAVTQVIMSSESAFLRRFKALRNDYTCANCFQLLGVDVIVDANIVPRIIEVNGEPSMQLSGEVNSHYDHTKKSMTHDLVKILFTTESYARELTALLYELELDGWNIGYLSLGGCATTDDICLRSIDLQYLLDFVKEEYNMGGFRRLYPAVDGDYYTRFLTHLESKLPYGTLTSTLRLHKLATTLARRSKVKQNNAIQDESFVQRAQAAGGAAGGASKDAEEEND
jgi:tubulin polyglutamylase TTLL4